MQKTRLGASNSSTRQGWEPAIGLLDKAGRHLYSHRRDEMGTSTSQVTGNEIHLLYQMKEAEPTEGYNRDGTRSSYSDLVELARFIVALAIKQKRNPVCIAQHIYRCS